MITPTSNRQTRLIVIAILFFGVVAGYVYYSRFTDVGDLGVPPLLNNPKDTLIQFKDTQFSFSIFESPLLRPLRTFGEVPVRPDLTGKNNPFTSF